MYLIQKLYLNQTIIYKEFTDIEYNEDDEELFPENHFFTDHYYMSYLLSIITLISLAFH